jgi:hypothetical protein
MVRLLGPLQRGLETARQAVADVTDPDDDVTVDDQGDHWVFEFIPNDDSLGGGARVSVRKADLSILSVIRGQ